MEIDIRGQIFQLLHQKAVFWKDTQTLLISDLHLGKITHFRKAGIAAPSAAYERNFLLLTELVNTTKAERIIFLGDLFHSRYNNEWVHFANWRNQYSSIDIQVVLGNHDILPPTLFFESNIALHDQLFEENFLFTHHPENLLDKNIFVFSGHIHPVYCLRAGGKQRIKLPCFVLEKNQLVLPSFGIFTGGYEIDDAPGRKVFVIVESKVMSV